MRLVYFVDGTWNAREGDPTTSPTNVSLLADRVRDISGQQRAAYLAGIGARSQGIERTLSGMFGLGTKGRVTQAYVQLCRDYDHRRMDHIYMFGFSRGAFAIRSLVGFVDLVGVQFEREGLVAWVEWAYRMYLLFGRSERSPLRLWMRKRNVLWRPLPEDRRLPIYFVGVWDTVPSIGLPGRWGTFIARRHQTQLPSNVTHARHALALHELRTPFEPLLWECRHSDSRAQSVKQSWFPGDHCDVGGGHRDAPHGAPSDGLSSVALQWMVEEAVECSGKTLQIDPLPRPSGFSVLHQNSDGANALMRKRIRAPLRRWCRLPASTVETMEFHPSALRAVLETPIHRCASRWPTARRLTAIDRRTLPLYFLSPYRTTLGRSGPEAPRYLWGLNRDRVLASVPAVEAFVVATGRPELDYVELASQLVIATLWKGESWVQALSLLIQTTGDAYDDAAHQRMTSDAQALTNVRVWWVRANVLDEALAAAVSQIPFPITTSVDRLREAVLTTQRERTRWLLERHGVPIDPFRVLTPMKPLVLEKRQAGASFALGVLKNMCAKLVNKATSH